VTYDDTEKKVILYESGTGYKFDLATGAMTIFADDIKLENVKADTPLRAESRNSGYVLYTAQHLSLLDKKGKVTYTKYYPPLSTTDFTQLAQFGADIAGVDIDVKGAMENMEDLELIAHGAYRGADTRNQGASQTQVVAGMYFGTSPVWEVTKTRYYNSRNARDHKFIPTKDEESKRSILMVNKDTGKTDKKISLTDASPLYVVDEVDNRVFLCEKNKTISCYDMK